MNDKTEQQQTPVKEQDQRPPVVATDMDRLVERMEDFFENIVPRGWLRARRDWPALGGLTAGWAPRMDVIDRDDAVVVRAEVPGVDKKDLDVSLTDNTVTIKGEMRREDKEEKGDYYRCEMARGAFARTITLPAGVATDQAKANFKDGVLELVLPKTATAQRRKIPVD